jgi:hypothetical protein
MDVQINQLRQSEEEDTARVLEKIERVRQARRNTFYLRDTHITLSPGFLESLARPHG